MVFLEHLEEFREGQRCVGIIVICGNDRGTLAVRGSCGIYLFFIYLSLICRLHFVKLVERFEGIKGLEGHKRCLLTAYSHLFNGKDTAPLLNNVRLKIGRKVDIRS